MTATEVYERKSEKMLMLGPVVERQIDELLRPLVEICVERVLANSEYLRQIAPEAIQNADVEINFVSILALAQKSSGSAILERALAMIGQVAQVDPKCSINSILINLWMNTLKLMAYLLMFSVRNVLLIKSVVTGQHNNKLHSNKPLQPNKHRHKTRMPIRLRL